MSSSFQERISQLFREIEIDLGATAMSALALQSLYEAVHRLKHRNHHEFFGQLLELKEDVENTKPRFAIVIDGFYEVLRLAYEEEIHHVGEDFPLKKRIFLDKLDEMLREKRRQENQLVKNAEMLKIEGREILIHDNSHTVQHMLAHLRYQGKHFRVIVAEQDPDKTGPIIEFLSKRQIPFRVVPAYMISHLQDHIDMFFLGTVTLKNTMRLVVDPGTKAIVSQIYLMKKPIYAFMVTSKFSLWESERGEEIHIHVHKRAHHYKPIEFERIKFSHDRVEVDLMTGIVTEEGIFTPAELKKNYQKKLKKRIISDRKFEQALKKLENTIQ